MSNKYFDILVMKTNLIVGKFVLMADVVAIIVLADVVLKFVADVIVTQVCYMCGRCKATVVGVLNTCIE